MGNVTRYLFRINKWRVQNEVSTIELKSQHGAVVAKCVGYPESVSYFLAKCVPNVLKTYKKSIQVFFNRLFEYIVIPTR